MLELAPLIKDLAIILGVASIVTLLFQKIRQPVVLGYLLAGFIIGPYTPPATLITDIPNIKILSELGVIFLMFSLGLEFSFHKLKRVGFSASITGLVEVVLMLAVGLLLGLGLGWNFENSLFLGACLAISSTTIIIKALDELKLKNKSFAELVFGVLIVEDLLAILLLVALSTITVTGNIFSLTLLYSAFKLIAVVGTWFLIGYFLVPTLLDRMTYYSNEETLTLVSVALCLFLVCIAAYFHYSTALGAFIMGSILAETTLVTRIEQLIHPIRDIFAAVFFVSVGMLIDPHIIIHNWEIILLLTAVTIIGKIITTSMGAMITGQNLNTSLRVGFSMAQIGEFSFIIVALGASLNVINSSLYPLIVAVSAITTFFTPYSIRFSAYLSPLLEKKLSVPLTAKLNHYAIWLNRMTSTTATKAYYSKIAMRIAINGLIITIIFMLANHLLLLKLHLVLSSTSAKVFIGSIILCLCSPFIYGMVMATRHQDSSNATLHTSLFALFSSSLIAAIEIFILGFIYFHSLPVGIYLVCIMILLLGLLYKPLEKYYKWCEKHLVNNLSDKSAKPAYNANLALWDCHLVEVRINPQSAFIGKKLSSLHTQYHIDFIALYRNRHLIFSPASDEAILAYDCLLVIGKPTQIDAFHEQAEILMQADLNHNDLLATISLQTILLNAKHLELYHTIYDFHKNIAPSTIIIGLERDGQRILNPGNHTELCEGDLLLMIRHTATSVLMSVNS